MDTRTWRLKALAISAAPATLFIIVVLATSRATMGQVLSLIEPYMVVASVIWTIVLVGCLLVALAKPLVTRKYDVSPLELVGGAVRRRWRDDYFLSMLWPMVLFGLLFGIFAVFKQTILRRHGFGDDPVFAAWDRTIFFGVQPWRLTHALPAPWTSLVLDRIYAFWYVPMIGILLACAFLRRSVEFRTRYLLAFVGCWTLVGGLMAYLLPAAGPCYAQVFHPGMTDYRSLMASLHGDEGRLSHIMPGTRLFALSTESYLLQLHESASLGFGGGISAMPSMHVAQASLTAAAAFRVGKVLGWIATAYALLIFVGSIHFGWHYAIDGMVAVAATVAIWIGSRIVVEKLLGPWPDAGSLQGKGT